MDTEKLNEEAVQNAVVAIMPQLIKSGFVTPVSFKESDFGVLIPKGKADSVEIPKIGMEYNDRSNKFSLIK